jgi:hypothetical protein
MANTITIKYSNTAGHVPTLADGEIAINQVDHKLYWRDSSGVVQSKTLNAEQAALVSGTNIKTINGATILGSGDLTVADTVTDNSITNAKLAQAATMTIKGNNTAGTANVTDLTAAQVLSMLKANTIGRDYAQQRGFFCQ